MRAIVDGSEAQGHDSLTAEEKQSFERIETEYNSLSSAIERNEKLLDIENLSSRSPQPSVETEARSADVPTEARGTRGGRGNWRERVGSEQYRSTMDRFIRSGGTDVEARAALAVDSGPTGGYLVASTLYDKIIHKIDAQSSIRQLATVVESSQGNPLNVPIETSEQVATYRTEGSAYNESEPGFGNEEFTGYSIGHIVKISDEMLLDSAFDLEAYIAQRAGTAIGLGSGAMFVNGASNSTTTPKGLFNQATVGITTATAGEFSADDLIALFYSVSAPYRINASWLMNDTTLLAVSKLKDAYGQYLWRLGLSGGDPDTILGKPVYSEPFAPTFADGSIVAAFGDIEAGYMIRDIGGMTLKVLDDRYADNGQIGFRFGARNDGAIVDTNAIRTLEVHA